MLMILSTINLVQIKPTSQELQGIFDFQNPLIKPPPKTQFLNWEVNPLLT